MQVTLKVAPTVTPVMGKTTAQEIASAYVAHYVDPSFTVVDGAYFHSKPLGREIWQFIIRCADAPLAAIEVDPQIGAVILLPSAKIHAIRERERPLLRRVGIAICRWMNMVASLPNTHDARPIAT